MSDPNESRGDLADKERVASHSDQLKSNWQRALEDMQAMADDREDQGYETLTIPAGDTTAVSPDMRDDGSWGLAHIVPNNYADDFEAMYEGTEFEETGVYQIESDGYVFIVTECISLSEEVVVFIAGTYDARFAGGLVSTAVENDEMYTHVRTLDHTLLGTFHHDDASAFFPDPDAFYAYDPSH